MGYFKLERGWSDHIVFDNEPLTQREAWVWLIEHAAWRDTVMSVGRERYEVHRGQLAASVRYLALRWQWSKSRVDRFLKRLKSETMIGTEERQHASIITICNYAKYQDEPDSDETEIGTPTGTAAGQQRDSSGTKKKQVKQIKQGKEEEIDTPPAVEVSDLVDAWNSVAEEVSLPKVNLPINPERRRALLARVKEHGRESWGAVMAKIRGSPYLRGEVNGWKCDFDFVIKRAKYQRILEGSYDGGSRVQGSKSRSTGGFSAIVLEQGFGRGFGGMEMSGGIEPGTDQRGEGEAGSGPGFAAAG